MQLRRGVLGTARELDHGWHFPLIGKRTKARTGVIVNKQTGVALPVALYSALENDPTLYDGGFQSTTCDVVVFAVQDLDETVRVLHTSATVPHRLTLSYRRI